MRGIELVEELDGLLLAWHLQLSKLEDITPESAGTLEAYHRSVGEYSAYEDALTIIAEIEPRTRHGQRVLIKKAFNARLRETCTALEIAQTEMEQWQLAGRYDKLLVIRDEWLGPRKGKQDDSELPGSGPEDGFETGE